MSIVRDCALSYILQYVNILHYLHFRVMKCMNEKIKSAIHPEKELVLTGSPPKCTHKNLPLSEGNCELGMCLMLKCY